MDVDVDDMMNGELHRIQANYFTMQFDGSFAREETRNKIPQNYKLHIVQSLD